MPEPVQTPVPVVVAGCGAITKFFYASALSWLEKQGVVRVAALCDPNEATRAGIHGRVPRALGLAKLEDAPLAPGTVVVVVAGIVVVAMFCDDESPRVPTMLTPVW